MKAKVTGNRKNCLEQLRVNTATVQMYPLTLTYVLYSALLHS